MSEEKTPFEKAEYNLRKFTENADMLHNINELKNLLATIDELSELEREGINTIIELAIKNLSEHISRKGEKWN
tara:strand:- start:25 stop:243 length:219 start_codon:yes stop_codon:yes gene_type:complete